MRSGRLAGVLLVMVTSGCATGSGAGADVAAPPDGSDSGRQDQPLTGSADRVIQVYDAVLRRYLTTEDPRAGDSHRATTVYVVDKTHTSAGNPMVPAAGGDTKPIPTAVQRAINKDLADISALHWVNNQDSVVMQNARCPHVRGMGVVITLGPVPVKDHRIEVGVGGFTACLAGSWLTYVVRTDGNGWTVSGTTGPIAMS